MAVERDPRSATVERDTGPATAEQHPRSATVERDTGPATAERHPRSATVERYPRSARRYHTAVYVVTLLLLATGWWLLAGREGSPSPLATLTGIPDARLHVWFGWALVGVALLPLPFALRAVVAFGRETLRWERGDLGWLARLPAAVLTGRFRRHEGHFDPGQRIANVAIVGLLVVLVATGVGLVLVTSGPAFAVLAAIHRFATITFTVVIAGHILLALGVLPGYRGVARSMHLGGRLPMATARRLWPGWTERTIATLDLEPDSAPAPRPATAGSGAGPGQPSDPPAGRRTARLPSRQHPGAGADRDTIVKTS